MKPTALVVKREGHMDVRTWLSAGLIASVLAVLLNTYRSADTEVPSPEGRLRPAIPPSTSEARGDSTSSTVPAPRLSSGDLLPVFPGAVGFGTTTPAGRGGQVLRVTNLNDDGAGSLRAAISASAPRVVVFDVSGTIVLSSNLTITEPFLTVAGQTAPSPGITLRGAGLIVSTHDVVVLHLRIRPGDDAAGPTPSTRDAFRLHGGSGVANVVLDHVSASWAIDENGGTSTSGTRRDLTISNSIISEGLHHSLHGDGPHSKGLLLGQGTQRVALVRSLLAHNYDRNPWFKGGTSGVVVNSVIYNWGNSKATYFTNTDSSLPDSGAVVGNVYLRGPNTPARAWPIQVATRTSGSRFYIADNTLNRAPLPSDPWSLVESKAGSGVIAAAPPVWPAGIAVLPSGETEAHVLQYAGARPADRDAVDARIVNEVRTGTGRIIDSTGQVGGWLDLGKTTRSLELPADPNGDADGDGYTNVEELLHQMAAAVEGR
jgi:hypothetical protein